MPAAPPDPFSPVAHCAHVALAVSGGSDSLALMQLAARWTSSREGSPRLSVLTVDHGLRADSGTEAGLVEGWAAALGLAHVTLVWNDPKPATGVQARARAARYDLMTGWCRSHGADALLTAHTLDDQAETVLMRMARTASIDSLAGIPPVGQWNGLRIVRPLLHAGRHDLRAKLEAWGQPWIEDPSNLDDRFERVRVRRALVTLADEGLPAARLAALADHCREVTDALDAVARRFIETRVRISAHGLGTFPAAAFLDLPRLVQGRILRGLLPLFGAGKPVLLAELERLAAALQKAAARRTLGGAVIWRRKADILIAREAGRIAAVPVRVPEQGEVVWDGRFVVTAPPGRQVVSGLRAPPRPRRTDVPRLVLDALPVVLEPSGLAVDPDFSGVGPVKARFLPLNSP